MKILVIILTSCQLEFLKLCFQSILNQKNTILDYDIVININTLDEKFYNITVKHFENIEDHNLKIIRTISNGRPGKGHNSCVEYFRKNPMYDYMFMIDGDDFFYPYAFYRIEHILQFNPTIVNLCGHDSIEISYSGFNKDINNTNPQVFYNFGVKLCRVYPNTALNSTYKSIHMSNSNPFIEGLGNTKNGSKNGTPSRSICFGKNIFNIIDKYVTLYDENMYIYDDFKMFLISFEEMYNKQEVFFIYDEHIYLYNKCNMRSVSFTDREKSDQKTFIDENYKSIFPNALKWQMNDILIYPPECTFFQSNDKSEYKYEMMTNLLKMGIINNIYPTTQPRNISTIVFIDETFKYTIDDIGNIPMNETELSFLNLMKNLSNINTYQIIFISQVDKSNENNRNNSKIKYISNKNIIDTLKQISPNSIIINGSSIDVCTIRDNIKNVKIFIWNYSNIKNQYTDASVNLIDKFIFNNHRLAENCTMIPDAKKYIMFDTISDSLVNNYRYRIELKKKTLVYISNSHFDKTSFSDTKLLRNIFLKIKVFIPDVKLKIFTSKYINKDLYNPLKIDDIDRNNDMFNNYKELIETTGIEFYGFIPELEMFKHCQEAMIYIYPCKLPEINNISILNMLYLGCHVITTDTCENIFNRFVDIIKLPYDTEKNGQIEDEWNKKFVNKIVQKLLTYYSANSLHKIHSQIEYIRENHLCNKQVDKIINMIN